MVTWRRDVPGPSCGGNGEPVGPLNLFVILVGALVSCSLKAQSFSATSLCEAWGAGRAALILLTYAGPCSRLSGAFHRQFINTYKKLTQRLVKIRRQPVCSSADFHAFIGPRVGPILQLLLG
ncbi:hypothetical protein BR93DRAFT_455582 [Coniochaeta sp. PMI_546]|nr:hypothetical protein BR93DRAFT_455582 [Coniochaeta sp. PMI_546]